jgi:hypothetical protein
MLAVVVCGGWRRPVLWWCGPFRFSRGGAIGASEHQRGQVTALVVVERRRRGAQDADDVILGLLRGELSVQVEDALRVPCAAPVLGSQVPAERFLAVGYGGRLLRVRTRSR